MWLWRFRRNAETDHSRRAYELKGYFVLSEGKMGYRAYASCGSSAASAGHVAAVPRFFQVLIFYLMTQVSAISISRGKMKPSRCYSDSQGNTGQPTQNNRLSENFLQLFHIFKEFFCCFVEIFDVTTAVEDFAHLVGDISLVADFL